MHLVVSSVSARRSAIEQEARFVAAAIVKFKNCGRRGDADDLARLSNSCKEVSSHGVQRFTVEPLGQIDMRDQQEDQRGELIAPGLRARRNSPTAGVDASLISARRNFSSSRRAGLILLR